MIDFKNENIEKITDFIASGVKSQNSKKIGVECEHIITDKKNKAVSFYGDCGIGQVLNLLAEFYPNRTYSDGYLVGLDDGKVFITLEPAAQIEVSIIPLESIKDIERLYCSFVKKITPILHRFGYQLLNVGYHPTAKADNLLLIPKERYRLMDSFFIAKGNKPRYMMRGSASVQVNIDYFSESDFAGKFRLANLLTPLFYLITDNVVIFEGEEYDKYSARSFAWENVDNSRCGFLNFGTFKEYAQWIYSKEPIFIQENGEDVFCENQSNEEIFKEKQITLNDIKHIMSMVFPNVRVKQFIEIRAGDSMPVEYMLAYACLIKGLFYNPDAVKEINSMFGYVTVEDMINQISLIRENGFNCNYYGYDMKKLINKVFDLAEEKLTAEEKQILIPLKDSATDFKTLKQLLSPEVTI